MSEPAKSSPPKKPYTEKPGIRAAEKVFESATLACGKCQSGPTQQFACRSLRKTS